MPSREAVIPESLARKGFKIHVSDPPPEDFDPPKATDKELAAYGLPRRPDEATQPQQRERWERVMARPQHWITPEFEHVEHITHGPAQETATAEAGSETATDEIFNGTGRTWSGFVQHAPAGKPFFEVEGRWTVPRPNTPNLRNQRHGTYHASQWVGIDGRGATRREVVQAGTMTKIHRDHIRTTRHVYAFHEWFPHGEVRVHNLPVSAGETMWCHVSAATPTSVGISMFNWSSGHRVFYTVTPPSGTRLKGNVAEWIVERPIVNDSPSDLADYVVCHFDMCSAFGSVPGGKWPSDANWVNIDGAEGIWMQNQAGVTLSSPFQEDAYGFRTDWWNPR